MDRVSLRRHFAMNLTKTLVIVVLTIDCIFGLRQELQSEVEAAKQLAEAILWTAREVDSPIPPISIEGRRRKMRQQASIADLNRLLQSEANGVLRSVIREHEAWQEERNNYCRWYVLQSASSILSPNDSKTLEELLYKTFGNKN